MLGVPQGSILEPLLFNIFSADQFLIRSDIDIANFADDNTPYLSAENVKEDVIESLERASVSLFRWFENSLFESNADKSHFLGSATKETTLNVNNLKITKRKKKTVTLEKKHFQASNLIPNLGLINILQNCVEELAEEGRL